MPRGNQLRVVAESGERPDVAKAKDVALIGRNVLRLHADETPNLVNLNALARQIANPNIVQMSARGADVREQGKHRFLRYAGHATRRVDRVTFD